MAQQQCNTHVLRKSWEQQPYLLISVEEVHEALMVIVMMWILGCVWWQQQVVGAQTMTLGISVREDA